MLQAFPERFLIFKMKKFIKTIPLFFLTLFIACSSEAKKKEEDSKRIAHKSEERIRETNTQSVKDFDACDCNKRSQKIIDDAIAFRLKFKSMDELKEDQASKKQVKTFARNYMALVKKCFEINNARLLVDSECNNLKLLQAKKDSLNTLGIQIEQGESIRL